MVTSAETLTPPGPSLPPPTEHTPLPLPLPLPITLALPLPTQPTLAPSSSTAPSPPRVAARSSSPIALSSSPSSSSPPRPAAASPTNSAQAAATPPQRARRGASAGIEEGGEHPADREREGGDPASPSSSVSGSSSPSSSPNPSKPSARRVKLYRLNQDSWSDLGTGLCTSEFLESSSGSTHPSSDDGAWITVKAEPPEGESEYRTILRTKIMPYPPGYNSDDDEDDDDESGERKEPRVEDPGGYQRQQDTLIVWTEPESESDMALSFATAAGCGEIWNFIRKARRWTAEQPPASPSPSPSISSPQTFPLYSMSTKLPEPTLGNIELLETTIRALGRTAVGRERMAATILRGDYVKKLIRIHEEAEDLESLSDLHALCRVMQTVLLLNDNGIFELILRDDVILGVASILEYDPEFPTMKASYRDHLADPSHFTQVVPIRSTSLLAKIHQTHRLHYLKDVVLARVLEDSTFSMLNSAIYFNEVDIVNEVASDPVLLKEVFAVFDEEDPGEKAASELRGVSTPPVSNAGIIKVAIGPQLPPEVARSLGLTPASNPQPASSMDVDGDTPGPNPARSSPSPTPDRKHDAILFLQQLCSMAKNLQLPLRSAFFRSLADRGLLRVIEVALSRTVTREDPVMRAATVEILMTLVDHDPNNVRGYSIKQHNAGKRPLAMFLMELFEQEEDLGLKAQMSEALRVLVDAVGEGGPLEAPPRMRPEDPDAEAFLQYFYDECITLLLAPIFNLPELSPLDPPLDLPLVTVALFGHLCDLLCFFISHHTFRSKYYVLSTDIAAAVGRLFATKNKHLHLAAIRFLRACIGRGDEFYNRFLMKSDLFGAVVRQAARERGRDNLVTSACLEFVEFVRTSPSKPVVDHLMEHHGQEIRQLALTLKTFEGLIVRWEQLNEPPPKLATAAESTATSKSMTRESSSWARMDVEEDNYFNGSDPEDDAPPAPSSSSPKTSRKREAESSDGNRKRVRIEAAARGSGLPRSKTWPVEGKGKGKGLVDYGDDEDDEEEEKEEEEKGGGKVGDAAVLEGRFVRASAEGSGGGDEPLSEVAKEEDAGPPPVPPRRKDDDDDDQLGLLLSAKRKPPVAAKSPAAGGTAVNRIKMAFGGLKSVGAVANLSSIAVTGEVAKDGGAAKDAK